MGADHWNYRNPVRILFGPGRLDELPALVGGRALVVTTEGAARRGLAARVTELLGESLVHDQVRSNPSQDAIEEAIGRWRGEGIETLVAVGGGSAIDVGKLLSLALAEPSVTLKGLIEPGDPWESVKPLPLVAVPTTAGTGAEVTPFATVWDDRHYRKHSIGTPALFPTAAIVDPELSFSLPAGETLSTGLDAYSQCFEAICSRNAMPLTDAFAERGLRLVPNALLTLQTDPDSRDARAAMAEAALLSGLAISQTRTGLAHSISYPVTARFGLPHGLACALALPGVLAYNVETDDGRLGRVATQSGLSGAEEIVPAILELYRQLGVTEAIRPFVSDVGLLAPYQSEMYTPGRADNNVRPVDASAIGRILASTESWFGAQGGES